MSYSESGPGSNFVINSLSNFDPTFSESKYESDDSESDFGSVFMNLDICIFYTLLNKLADDFFLSILITESIVMQAMQV